jgi:hypothetical protein
VDDVRVYTSSIDTPGAVIFLDPYVEDDNGVGWGGLEGLKSVWSEGCRFDEGRSSVLTAILIQVGRRDAFRISTEIDEAVIENVSERGGRQREQTWTKDRGSSIV